MILSKIIYHAMVKNNDGLSNNHSNYILCNMNPT